MQWYLFKVYKWGKAADESEIHLHRVSSPEQDATDASLLRKLSPEFYILPGPSNCIWEGYVAALDHDKARRQVCIARDDEPIRLDYPLGRD